MTTFAPARADVPGPVAGTRMTPRVLRQIGRLAYVRAWPMVNEHNRRVAFEQVPTNGLIGGVIPAASLNNKIRQGHVMAQEAQR